MEEFLLPEKKLLFTFLIFVINKIIIIQILNNTLYYFT